MILNTDGGARGNPGPGAYGVVIKNDDKEVIFEMGNYLGKCTNNEAEYRGLIAGLKKSLEMGHKNLRVFLDSELIVKQVRGEYKIKSEGLRGLYSQVKELETKFENISFNHVPRELNKEADQLVNKVLDEVLKG
jgi:ribonuclease HI